MAHARSRSTLGESTLLALGFLALTGAVLAAHSAPATGYELSLYSSTPLSFWALLGCALFVSLLGALRATTDWYRWLALGLGGVSMATFVGLPVVRGYRFYGAGDALTHLGWMRSIQSGAFSPIELRYPALHLVTTFLSVTVGIDLAQAALLVIIALSCLFFAFVALSTSLIFQSRFSTVVGAFSAFLFLPITTIHTFIVPHAMSQAILFSSVSIFLLLKYLRSPASLRSPSGMGMLFALTSIALVVYHPQLAAHVLVMFLGITILQFLYRRYRADHPIATHRPIAGQTVLLTAVFLAWISKHGFFSDVFRYALSSATSYFVGGGAAAEAVNSQGSSLSEIGVSLLELVLKLLGPSLLFLFFAGVLVLWSVRNRDLTARTSGLVPYFVVSLIALAGVFAVYFFGSYSAMYFRVFGLMMVLVTIMGAVAIAHGTTALSRNYRSTTVYSVSIVGFGIVLLLSLLVVFPSPYVYQSSPHITDMSMEGYQTTFENKDENVTFTAIRGGPSRYEDAIYGDLERTQKYDAIYGEAIADGIPQQYAEDRYLVMTRADREREVVAYRELRYSRSQLDSISSQTGVSRVHSNGEYTLYYVRGAADGEETTA
ncbi:hypothetical protein [Natrinema sp. 1APR25-10V2]|uniref:hypothetical protein n=1 Tax=Natrinema sp. 1APR25-10V2 TaxID=2951081 RepID=UPI0028751EF8|nr:hypothetical protein [Natrinema sp. 1APR25-10V2]MDS0475114.1 hypothetical protein [Natrinema sp. 1APR25-10V2]